MGLFVTTLLFLGVAGMAFAVADRFVKRWLPASQPASQPTMVVIGALLVFASVFFFTAWGFNPAVIQVNLQQSLNPLRWINWVLSALNFGVAQAFILALFRSRVERARRLATLPPPAREIEQALAEDPAPAAVLEVGEVTTSVPVGEPMRTQEHAFSEETVHDDQKQGSTFGFARPPFKRFARGHNETHLAKKKPALTRGELVVMTVLAVWVVVHFIVLQWVRTL